MCRVVVPHLGKPATKNAGRHISDFLLLFNEGANMLVYRLSNFLTLPLLSGQDDG